MAFENVFVTVGTTEFDNLLDKLSTKELALALANKGCRNLTIQYGNSRKMNVDFLNSQGISTKIYRLKPSIQDDIENADLVISHAGAGSCLEVLRALKPLVVVINTDLMDNHQFELAQKLHAEEHLFYCTVNDLEQTLLFSEFQNLKKYKTGNMQPLYGSLDELVGFQRK